MSDRKQLDEQVVERWGDGIRNELKRMSYNAAMLALKYGPTWQQRATKDELELAKFYNGHMLL